MTDQHTPSVPWQQRLANYLDHLEICIDRLDQTLQQLPLGSGRGEPQRLEQVHEQLLESLQTLESLIAQRAELIGAADTPAAGDSLQAILNGCHGEPAQQLAARCRRVAKRVATSHDESVARFVCQFHLAEVSQDLICLIRGIPGPRQTYGNGQSQPQGGAAGGTLFSESV